MKTFFSIEDIETVFRDAYDQGFHDGSVHDVRRTDERWNDYKNQSNQTVFQSQASIPATSPKPTDLICPDCGAKMVSRKGQYGTFWGCSTYPKCRGTRDSNGLSKAEREAAKVAEEPKEFQHQEGFGFRKGK